MLIHLKHPKHGLKSTTVEAEAQWDEKHGWERYVPGEVVLVNELAEKRKPGRPRKQQ